MERKGITEDALKMAWKMTGTIVPRYNFPSRERNALLTALTGIALDDLLQSGSVAWRKPLSTRTILVLEGRTVHRKEAQKTRLALKHNWSTSETERAVEWAEEVFDKYGLSEEERATLCTALPCLGLHSLQDHLVWKKEPPFPELG